MAKRSVKKMAWPDGAAVPSSETANSARLHRLTRADDDLERVESDTSREPGGDNASTRRGTVPLPRPQQRLSLARNVIKGIACCYLGVLKVLVRVYGRR